MAKLAVNDGPATARLDWPIWPVSDERLERDLAKTLRSGRWTISGPYRGHPSKELIFGEAFAQYCGRKYGVPVCNGTHALMTALEALDIGPGDEVIVPGLTWVADATAVINANATPILVDVDETLGLSPAAVEQAVTPKTRAIIAVHLYCAMPDWDALAAIAGRHGIALIEDAAQAHGAAWKDGRAGSLGLISAFSFQQSKLLTSGEGGIALTDDKDLYQRMKRIRCDGRDYLARPMVGEQDLDERQTPLMGSNYCMSDVAATMLLSRLPDLDGQIEFRTKNMDYLEQQLSEIPGVEPVKTLPNVTVRPAYEYAIRVHTEAFEGASLDRIISALRAEVAVSAGRTDPPLHRSNLYRPHTKRRFMWPGRSAEELNPERFDLPHAQLESERLILLPHSAMLAEHDHMDALVQAFAKIQRNANEL